MIILSDTSAVRSTWEHRQLAILLRRGWTAIVLGVVIGLLAGAIVTRVETKKYTASASVFVTSTGVVDSSALANARTTGTINLDTESHLVKSTSVAEQVQKLDPSATSLSLSALIAGVQVTVPANTEILNIQYVASSPTLAAQRANDFATAYLLQRQTDAQATLNAQIKTSQTDLTTLTTRLKAVAAALGTLPPTTAKLNFVQAQRALLISQITGLTAQLTKLTTTVVTPGRSLTKATAPSSQSSPSPILNLSGGLAVGLLLGLVGAWLRFAVRKRLRRPDDVLTKLHLPVLGTVAASRGPALVPIASDSFQSYRRIGNVITATLGQTGIVLVTGQCTAMSSATVAANIARALARSGVPVKVTSTDSAASSTMCSALLAGDPIVNDAWVALPTSESLNRHSLDAIRGGGLLIVTAPDPDHSADAQTVAALSDAVLIVVEARTKADHTKVMKQLDAVGAPMLGAVLVPSGEWWRRAPAATEQPDRKGGPARVAASSPSLADREGQHAAGSTPVADDLGATEDEFEPARPASSRYRSRS